MLGQLPTRMVAGSRGGGGESLPHLSQGLPASLPTGAAVDAVELGTVRQQPDEQCGVLFEVPVGEKLLDDPAAAVLAHAPA